MFLICYLVASSLFYYFAAKRAPILEDPSFDYAPQPAQAEIIELFADRAEGQVKKAA